MIKVYHGSNIPVPDPQISKGRDNADFGLGFYVTDNYEMAEKWASRKKGNAVISEYELDIDKLRTYRFDLDSEWLNFVIYHRSQNKSEVSPALNTENYDAFIGPTADDKMFSTIEQYEDGLISEEIAVKALNAMDIDTQINIRTQDSINKHLRYIGSRTLGDDRKKELYLKTKKEHKAASNHVEKLIKESIANGRKTALARFDKVLSDNFAPKDATAVETSVFNTDEHDYPGNL